MALKYSSLVGGGKTMVRTTLTSGTSYTVPAGVMYLNVTLYGGGGGGGGPCYNEYNQAADGLGGEVISSTLSTTPGASIAYAIGAGGSGGGTVQAGAYPGATGSSGGTTTFTGATSAVGGSGGVGVRSGSAGGSGSRGAHPNGGMGANSNNTGGAGSGGTGGNGKIDIEYWV